MEFEVQVVLKSPNVGLGLEVSLELGLGFVLKSPKVATNFSSKKIQKNNIILPVSSDGAPTFI